MNKLLGILLTVMTFSLVVAVCYLWGYWGTFDIDIMYYLSFGELVVISVAALLGICVMLILCISISSVLNLEKSPSTQTPIYNNLLRPELIYSLSLLAIIVIVIIGGTAQWLLLAIPFSLFLTTFIVANGSIFSKILENQELFYVVLIATMLPSLAFGYGKTQGLQVETASNYKQVTLSNSSTLNSVEELRYIGKAGNYIFLQDSSNNQIVITSLNENQHLILSKLKSSPKASDTE